MKFRRTMKALSMQHKLKTSIKEKKKLLTESEEEKEGRVQIEVVRAQGGGSGQSGVRPAGCPRIQPCSARSA